MMRRAFAVATAGLLSVAVGYRALAPPSVLYSQDLGSPQGETDLEPIEVEWTELKPGGVLYVVCHIASGGVIRFSFLISCLPFEIHLGLLLELAIV
jgi:hypothetical protein